MRKWERILYKVPVALSLCFSLYRVELALATGRGGLLKDISFGNGTISGALFGISKGVSYFGARKAELAFLFHMVIIVMITAALYGLILIM